MLSFTTYKTQILKDKFVHNLSLLYWLTSMVSRDQFMISIWVLVIK
jgi:hypothetical protein